MPVIYMTSKCTYMSELKLHTVHMDYFHFCPLESSTVTVQK